MLIASLSLVLGTLQRSEGVALVCAPRGSLTNWSGRLQRRMPGSKPLLRSQT
ncbi:MAG: hypothetical protein ACJAYU_005332 [Bradymonadia bacterium]